MRAIVEPDSIVEWYPTASPRAVQLDAAISVGTTARLKSWFPSGGHGRPIVYFRSDSPLARTLSNDRDAHPDAYFLGVQLKDRSWVLFSTMRRIWGLGMGGKIGVAAVFVLISIVASSGVATYYLVRPIKQFTEGLRRFGADPRAPPLPEAGPQELRATIRAFNAMQAQIRKFVEDRTVMLAAISHDLRTPLTKIRLRGEFIEDEDQRARLFRDVEDLQAMADSALAFFRDDHRDENATTLDFPVLLRTIIDDYADQGAPVAYAGPDHAVFRGRPFALKRACNNLIGNAVKYAGGAEWSSATLPRDLSW